MLQSRSSTGLGGRSNLHIRVHLLLRLRGSPPRQRVSELRRRARSSPATSCGAAFEVPGVHRTGPQVEWMRFVSPRRIEPPLEGKSLVISVRAKPRSSVGALEQDAAGTWIARLRSSPVDGKANEELIALVARHFGCARSCVSIVSGTTARLKRVRVSATTGDPTRSAQPPARPDRPPAALGHPSARRPRA